MIILLGMLFISGNSNQGKNELFEKLNQEDGAGNVIMKHDINKKLCNTLIGYQKEFHNTGVTASVGNIFAGIIQGIKADTLYEIVIVFENKRVVYNSETPKEIIYKKGNSLVTKYIIGGINIGYTHNDSCLEIQQNFFSPQRVDTLNEMFSYKNITLLEKNQVIFCP